MLREREGLMVKSIPKLSLEVVYPPFSSKINLNTCGDPDCGNFGVAPDFSLPTFKEPGAQQRKMAAPVSIPALASGRRSYTLNGDDKKQRISTVFEYEDDPHGRDDGREMVCRHQKRNRSCDISFNVLSNNHFEDEFNRLRLQNDLLKGPVCGNCGQRYLDAPEEFIFNGTHGKLNPGKNGRKAKPAGFRIIHKPCQGQKGARIEKRRKAAPSLSTPAVRLGADKRPKGADMEKAPAPLSPLVVSWNAAVEKVRNAIAEPRIPPEVLILRSIHPAQQDSLATSCSKV